MNGLHEIINHFTNRLKLAVCTGAPGEFLEIVLNKLDLQDAFDVCQTSDNIDKGKPDPEIYLKTCMRLNLNPSDCVVLEDSENGVVAGKDAGCYVIAVPSEYTKSQSFGSADFIATDLNMASHHIRNRLRR
jgi:HAD superfamily hydrolase (TIGR01509 family)